MQTLGWIRPRVTGNLHMLEEVPCIVASFVLHEPPHSLALEVPAGFLPGCITTMITPVCIRIPHGLEASLRIMHSRSHSSCLGWEVMSRNPGSYHASRASATTSIAQQSVTIRDLLEDIL